MRAEPDNRVDFWDDDFESMTDEVHSYILEQLDEDVDYSEISGERAEIESGYTYSTEGSEFKFSLAGTVNSDREILREGKRKIVLQTEQEDDSFQKILGALEQRTVRSRKRSYGEIQLYEFEIDTPYS